MSWNTKSTILFHRHAKTIRIHKWWLYGCKNVFQRGGRTDKAFDCFIKVWNESNLNDFDLLFSIPIKNFLSNWDTFKIQFYLFFLRGLKGMIKAFMIYQIQF